MDTRTDEDLAAGVARGSRDDLEAVVERHHRPLIGFLYIRVGGDIRLAEDLAQETFVRVMRGIGTYRPSSAFKPWLYAIAANLAHDHVKSADARRTGAELDAEIAAPDDIMGVEEGLMQDEAGRQVALVPDQSVWTTLARWLPPTALLTGLAVFITFRSRSSALGMAGSGIVWFLFLAFAPYFSPDALPLPAPFNGLQQILWSVSPFAQPGDLAADYALNRVIVLAAGLALVFAAIRPLRDEEYALFGHKAERETR